jgi:hypothetical protein
MKIDMPLQIIMEAKVVRVKDDNIATILTILKASLKKGYTKRPGSADQTPPTPTEPTTRLLPSDLKPRNGCWATLVTSFEKLTGNYHGGNEVTLERVDISLDPPAVILRDSYINCLNQLMEDESLSSQETEANTIDNPFILVREILIRLASTALSKDLNVKADGDELITIMEDFISNIRMSSTLKKSSYSNIIRQPNQSKMLTFLTTDHEEWLQDFKVYVNAINMIHANERCISEISKYLREIQLTIMRLILAELNPPYPSTDYSDGWIKKKLTEFEETLFKRYATSYPQVLALLQSPDNATLPSCESFSMNPRQTCIISSFNPGEPSLLHTDKKKPANLKRLYDALHRTNLLLQIVFQIDLLITTMGWVPVLLGIVQFETVDKLIRDHSQICSRLALQNDSPIFTTSSPFTNAINKYNVNHIIRNTASTGITACEQMKKFRDPQILNQLVRIIYGSLSTLYQIQQSPELKTLTESARLIDLTVCRNFTLPFMNPVVHQYLLYLHHRRFLALLKWRAAILILIARSPLLIVLLLLTNSDRSSILSLLLLRVVHQYPQL